MSRSNLKAPVIAFAVCAWTVGLASQAAREPRAASAAIDAQLSAAVARGDIPGGVVAVAATKDRLLYRGAFGKANETQNRLMRADTLFRVFSMTKAVTSVAAMQLYEQHRFTLDDPAPRYLPELQGLSVIDTFDHATGTYTVHRAAHPVTIRQLFTHTAGFGYSFTSPIVRDFKPKDGERFAAGPLLFEPGVQWMYGTSVDWLGRLVETLSGQNLEAYFHDHIFMPSTWRTRFITSPRPSRHVS